MELGNCGPGKRLKRPIAVVKFLDGFVTLRLANAVQAIRRTGPKRDVRPQCGPTNKCDRRGATSTRKTNIAATREQCRQAKSARHNATNVPTEECDLLRERCRSRTLIELLGRDSMQV